MEELLKIFKKKFEEEIKDINFETIYQNLDILESIPEYLILTESIEKNPNIKTRIDIIELTILKKYKLCKIPGEETYYYALRGEPYDGEGNLIEDSYEEKYENEDLFCEYLEDKIFLLMKKTLTSKIEKEKKKNREFDEDYGLFNFNY